MLTDEQKELCRRLREDLDVTDVDAIAAADLIELLAAHSAGAQDETFSKDYDLGYQMGFRIGWKTGFAFGSGKLSLDEAKDDPQNYAQPITDAARDVMDHETALRGCRILSNIVSAYDEGNHGGRVIHLIGVAKSWIAEIERLDRAKGE